MGAVMTAPLTEVDLLWFEGRVERWVRFGHAVEERIVDRRQRVLAFAPDTVFAFVRWASNDFGTVVSRLDIMRAVRPGEARSTVPYVRPGGEILLRLQGWPKVQQVLETIDAVEALGIEPGDAAPDYWRHLHNRMSAGEPVRAYTRERHRAWLLRRELEA